MTIPAVAFVASAHKMEEMPPDSGREVAFVGRSNAGKSSAINALANRHRLAFVSKTPGRTQTINFFSAGARVMPSSAPSIVSSFIGPALTSA